MKIVHGEAVFDSGRVEHSVNCDIIGINPELETYSGYDGTFAFHSPEMDDREPLTPAERAELADYMIGLWLAYRGKTA